MEAPRHVLLVLDDEGDLHSVGEESDGEVLGDARREPPDRSDDGGARTTTSRFWGVSWDRRRKKWEARYRDADGKQRFIGSYDDEEEAARAANKAIRDAGLEDQRPMNAVDATGALVPRERFVRRDRSTVVAPDPARDPTAATSKFWGVSWNKGAQRWKAEYKDASGKTRYLGLFDTQEEAARAYNAAVRALPPDVQARRQINPVVDGQLVPKPPRKPSSRKRRRKDAPAAGASASRSRQE